MDEMARQEGFVEEGITLQQLLKIMWNNIILIMLVTLWVTVIGIIYTFVIVTPKYTATSQVIVQVDWSNTQYSEQTAIAIANALMLTYQEFVVSDLVLESVIEDVPTLGNISAASLKKMVTISSKTGVYIFYIRVEHPTPEVASAVADKIVENSITIANDPENGFLFLQNKLKKVPPDAKVPSVPSSPNKVLNVMISFILGAILSLGIIFVKEMFNNKYQTKDDVERHLNLRVIATVPGTIKERKLVD